MSVVPSRAFGWFVAVSERIWLAIGGVLVLGISWLAQNFVLKPYLDFLNVRQKVHEALVSTANVGPMSRGTSDYSNAVDLLRSLGAQILTMQEAVVHPFDCIRRAV